MPSTWPPIKADFDMRKFNPRYALMNGRAYPDTAPDRGAGGDTVLLRYVNAGVLYHSMGVLGAGQTVIALDGSPLDHALPLHRRDDRPRSDG